MRANDSDEIIDDRKTSIDLRRRIACRRIAKTVVSSRLQVEAIGLMEVEGHRFDLRKATHRLSKISKTVPLSRGIYTYSSL